MLLGPSPGGRRLRLLIETQELNSSNALVLDSITAHGFQSDTFHWEPLLRLPPNFFLQSLFRRVWWGRDLGPNLCSVPRRRAGSMCMWIEGGERSFSEELEVCQGERPV